MYLIFIKNLYIIYIEKIKIGEDNMNVFVAFFLGLILGGVTGAMTLIFLQGGRY